MRGADWSWGRSRERSWSWGPWELYGIAGFKTCNVVQKLCVSPWV